MLGPRSPSLLGTTSPEALRQAVLKEDTHLLSQVPGIGPKTARAIIFHLKDRIISTGAEPTPLLSDIDTEVIAALTSLGFSLVEAQAALQSLPSGEDAPAEERVRQALAYFAAP